VSGQARGLDWLFDEIQRRGLMHAAGVYAVVCWFLVQLLATVAPYLQLEDWVVRVAIAATFAGLPLVLAGAWLVGGGPEEEGAPAARPAPAPPEARDASRLLGLPSLEAVALALLAFVGGALWAYRHFDVARLQEAPASAAAPVIPPEVTRRSVAVLPFENVGGDPDEEFFSEGVAEEIRSALARVPSLRVASRTSSERYVEMGATTRRIGAELLVGSLLEGSVQRAGERLRVTVRLVDTRTDEHLWSDSYERGLAVESLFDVEEEIARSVARALEVELAGAADAVLVSRPAVSLRAHDLYLLGLYHWNRRTGEELRTAADFFRSAIEREPGYALAHAGLANTHVLMPLYAGVPSAEAMPAARRAAEEALALDGTLAEAHAALAFVKTTHDWDWVGAEEGFLRAIELNPSYATAHEWYGALLDAVGRREEARAQLERAVALDPLSVILNAVLGFHFTFEGNYPASIDQLERTLELQRDFPLGLEFLALASLHAGLYDDAEHALRTWAERTGTAAEPWGAIVAGIESTGLRREGLEALDRLADRGTLSPYRTAQYASLLRDARRALEALERGVGEKDFLMFWVDADPAFDPLRDEPRYRAILEEMGLSGARGAAGAGR